MKREKLADVQEKIKKLEDKLIDKQDRIRAIGMYLQSIRVMRDFKFHEHPERFFIKDFDIDRILDILEMDDYPEGF